MTARGALRPVMMLGIVLLAVLQASPGRAAGVAVRAWLDRDTMHLGETVTLNVEAQGSVDAQPDFSALATDFKLLGTQSSQQVDIINGAQNAKTLWAVGLEPRHAGRIVVPALSVAGSSTAALTLTVLAQPAGAQGHPGDDVFLEVTAEPLAPYVQQQVRYTVKLYYAFDLTDGNLPDPAADGLVSQRLGQDKHYLATVGQRRYHVIERRYTLKPERSGVLTIPALTFRGTALDASDPTGFFSRGRSVGARSDSVQLNVRAQPQGWGSDPWLPAASVTLSDETPLPDRVKVGDPVTRTLRVQAKGLGYEQLPEITLPAPDGAEIYPDKAQTRTRDDGTWIYGERVRKFAFVPTRPGRLVIPGYRLHWWDTVHDRAATAELPAHVVEAVAAGASTLPVPASATPRQATPSAVATTPAAAASTPAPCDSRWPWVALAAFVLWLLTLGLWWRSRHRRRTSVAMTPAPGVAAGTGASDARARFLRDCALGDLAAAERDLVAWAHAERPAVRNLGELAARLDDPQQVQGVRDLERTRYAGVAGDGLAGRLAQEFGKAFAWSDRDRHRAAAGAPLPPLYP
jgi:hypothetical protein